ncbi:MAG TPA: hypothetical protein VJ802_05205 [Gemmatimonadaceae bacterium]|nr:hypothetical protein [Gemmatimonadaceae bacterium]
MDVSATLQQGVEILAPALTPHGFRFEFRDADKGTSLRSEPARLPPEQAERLGRLTIAPDEHDVYAVAITFTPVALVRRWAQRYADDEPCRSPRR